MCSRWVLTVAWLTNSLAAAWRLWRRRRSGQHVRLPLAEVWVVAGGAGRQPPGDRRGQDAWRRTRPGPPGSVPCRGASLSRYPVARPGSRAARRVGVVGGEDQDPHPGRGLVPPRDRRHPPGSGMGRSIRTTSAPSARPGPAPRPRWYPSPEDLEVRGRRRRWRTASARPWTPGRACPGWPAPVGPPGTGQLDLGQQRPRLPGGGRAQRHRRGLRPAPRAGLGPQGLHPPGGSRCGWSWPGAGLSRWRRHCSGRPAARSVASSDEQPAADRGHGGSGTRPAPGR
jgi:hypothetical protein